MPADDPEESRPTGPWSPPPRPSAVPPQAPQPARRRLSWSAIFFVLILTSIGIRAYRDLSRPEAWAYWKDQYFAPSLSATLIPKIDLDGAMQGHAALAIRGVIGAAAAS